MREGRMSCVARWAAGFAAGLGLAQCAQAADAPSAGRSAAARRPNIVLILADDLGYGDAHCFDPQFSKIATPNIDRLASQGMCFTDAHSASAVCTPTRYSILTGRYGWRTRLRGGVLKPWEGPLIAADRLTLPAMLKQQGYHCAAIGKWHLGMDWPATHTALTERQKISNGPTARGFDYYFGTDVPNYPPFAFQENDHLTQAATAVFEHDGKDRVQAAKMVVSYSGPMVPGWRFEDILPTITDKAVTYITQEAEKKEPFFLYFALTTPHEPISPSKAFHGKSGISPVADLIMETDWAVGRTMEALERNGVADNTLIIFTSDNGHCAYTGLDAFHQAGHRVNGPYRGNKGDIWEGGHRVPFVARWPGTIAPGSCCKQTISLADMMATCADITGFSLPDNAAEDSFSVLPLMQGQTDRPVRETVVLHSVNAEFALRQGKWLIAFGPDKNATGDQPHGELYDLDADVEQRHDLWHEDPTRVAAMMQLLQKTIDAGRTTAGTQRENDRHIELWNTSTNPLPTQ